MRPAGTGREGVEGADVAVFEAREVDFRYPGASAPALRGLGLRVGPGTTYAVIGPNGSGKSTLLGVLVGRLKPSSGTVLHRGRPVLSYDRRELARQIGVVPQVEQPTFPLSVRESVAMGRYPHLGLLGREGPQDRRAVDEAMARADVLHLGARSLSTLSGGERQRVRIARALAQKPASLVLDEPTVSLDIQHEMEIFELLKGLAEEGVTVIVVTHNLNLAARYARRLLLLNGGEWVAEGPPPSVLRREVVERVYCWPVTVAGHPGPGPDAGAPQVVPLAQGANPAGA